jgi:N-acetylglucosamine-6-phosphate deacetylase
MASDNKVAIEGRLLWPGGEIKQGFLVSDEAGRISIISEGPLPEAHRSNSRVLQLSQDHIAVPGYIDVQINGGFGEEVKSNPTAVATLRTRMPKFGVTSFMPTITSLPIEAYAEVLANIHQQAPGAGSEVLGVHLEGPFLNKTMRGGHPQDYLAIPSAVNEKDFANDSLVRMVTLAPELDGALPLIERLATRGIVVGVGHSCADEKTLQEALTHGLQWGTHIFNAMNPIKGRELGLAGYLLTERKLTAGIIVDGIHVHPRMAWLTYQMKGPDSLILMTDSSAVTGLSPGTYDFRNRQITTDGVSARLPDGTLVGSILTLDRAVRNMIAFTGCSLADAVHMASAGPAQLVGMHKRKGILAVGADADVAILDAAFEVVATVVQGRVAYEST